MDAIVVASPTHAHKDIVIAAAEARKPTFCEKPLALSLADCRIMEAAVQRQGTFFQMGFMRRFDPGYAAANRQVAEGRIGRPVVFKATSRDPFRPSLEYANPASSGGILVDMGIHDFDLARWFMGEVKTVSAIGGVLAYPEMASVGDIDNAIASLVFDDGRLGVVDLTRNGFYGYDIVTELLGTEGTLRIGYLRETPVLTMTKNNVSHDTVPYSWNASSAPIRCNSRTSSERPAGTRGADHAARMASRPSASRSPRRRPIGRDDGVS